MIGTVARLNSPISSTDGRDQRVNGCADLDQMRARIGPYRGGQDDSLADPEIGCIMQRDVRFFDPEDAPAAPPGWSGNIVQGRS